MKCKWCGAEIRRYDASRDGRDGEGLTWVHDNGPNVPGNEWCDWSPTAEPESVSNLTDDQDRATPEPSDAMVEAAMRRHNDGGHIAAPTAFYRMRLALAAALATGEYVPKTEADALREERDRYIDIAGRAEAALADARAEREGL